LRVTPRNFSNTRIDLLRACLLAFSNKFHQKGSFEKGCRDSWRGIKKSAKGCAEDEHHYIIDTSLRRTRTILAPKHLQEPKQRPSVPAITQIPHRHTPLNPLLMKLMQRLGSLLRWRTMILNAFSAASIVSMHCSSQRLLVTQMPCVVDLDHNAVRKSLSNAAAPERG
jgi:hypothetical protein